MPTRILTVAVDLTFLSMTPPAAFGQVTVTPEYAGTDPGSVVNVMRVDFAAPQIQFIDPSPSIVVRAGTAKSEAFVVYVAVSL